MPSHYMKQREGPMMRMMMMRRMMTMMMVQQMLSKNVSEEEEEGFKDGWMGTNEISTEGRKGRKRREG